MKIFMIIASTIAVASAGINHNPFANNVEDGFNGFGNGRTPGPFGNGNPSPYGNENLGPFGGGNGGPFGEDDPRAFGGGNAGPFGNENSGAFGGRNADPFGRDNPDGFGGRNSGPFGGDNGDGFGNGNSSPFGNDNADGSGNGNSDGNGNSGPGGSSGGAGGKRGNGRGRPGPQIRRFVSVFVGPEEPVDPTPRIIRVPGGGDKHFNIIFVKAPSSSSQQRTEVVLPEQPLQRNLVYVLLKRDETADNVKVRAPVPTQPSKPSVFFIRYRDPKAANATTTTTPTPPFSAN